MVDVAEKEEMVPSAKLIRRRAGPRCIWFDRERHELISRTWHGGQRSFSCARNALMKHRRRQESESVQGREAGSRGPMTEGCIHVPALADGLHDEGDGPAWDHSISSSGADRPARARGWSVWPSGRLASVTLAPCPIWPTVRGGRTATFKGRPVPCRVTGRESTSAPRNEVTTRLDGRPAMCKTAERG